MLFGKEINLKACWALLAILVTMILAGCRPVQSATNIPPTDQSPSGILQTPADASSGNPGLPINTPDFSEITPPPAAANPFIKLAEEDLANRLTITVDQIHFLKISDIDWQDITQGCTASPGQALTKGSVSGYRIWLEANGKNYLYHIGLDNTLFRCPE